MLLGWGHEKTVLAHARNSDDLHEEDAHVQMLNIERECDGGSATDVFGEVSEE
jgi:hypothetical protein